MKKWWGANLLSQNSRYANNVCPISYPDTDCVIESYFDEKGSIKSIAVLLLKYYQVIKFYSSRQYLILGRFSIDMIEEMSQMQEQRKLHSLRTLEDEDEIFQYKYV